VAEEAIAAAQPPAKVEENVVTEVPPAGTPEASAQADEVRPPSKPENPSSTDEEANHD
jgi:hypothetical protein